MLCLANLHSVFYLEMCPVCIPRELLLAALSGSLKQLMSVHQAQRISRTQALFSFLQLPLMKQFLFSKNWVWSSPPHTLNGLLFPAELEWSFCELYVVARYSYLKKKVPYNSRFQINQHWDSIQGRHWFKNLEGKFNVL